LPEGGSAVSVGVIGAGGMGGRHAGNLSRVARVFGVSDLDPERARKVALGCGARVFESPGDLIRHPEVEAVVVASPDHTHAGLVLECLRYEKPVLCEKPLTTGVEDAREILESEVELGRKLVRVGFMRRCDPHHVEVKRAADSGAVGRPLLFKGWHRNAGGGPGMTSESVLRASAVHDLDSARWLLGQEIEEVYVTGTGTGREGADGVRDLQLLQLRMSGGALASVEVYTTARYGYEVGLELVGETGTLAAAQPAYLTVRRDGVRARSVPADWLQRFSAAYELEVRWWVECVRNGSTGGPNAWDGYASILAVERCLASLNSGMPERLPQMERPALYRDRVAV
jgi:myo-inositol 2-dehydrogenase/D-chiro-inositol 1-dehydrogenase